MKRSNVPTIVLVIVSILLCCLCILIVGAGAAVYGLWNIQTQPTSFQARPADPLPRKLPGTQPNLERAPFIRPTPLPLTPLEENTFSEVSTETLRVLDETIVPVNNLIDLAQRLEGKNDIPVTIPAPVVPYQLGDTRVFWVTNVDTNQNFQAATTLRYVTDHTYFWIENSVPYDENHLRRLAETFEEQIYHTNRDFFGSEWTPGVDNDPHLYIVLARGLGRSVAGYFSSADEYSPLAHEYSNGHEMFLLNADNISLGDTFTYGVLAHEFQHMIHWYQDRNEETWMNEGFAELASFLNGFGTGGSDTVFIQEPDHQLTDWPDNGNTFPAYGASFLFLNYFLNRFGEETTQAVVSSSENGMKSIDQVLQDLDIRDPVSGEQITADAVFADWVIANYLQDLSIADGRYGYLNYPDAPQVQNYSEIRRCPQPTANYSVNQYGTDYFRLQCAGEYTLRIEGEASVRVLPTQPYSGNFVFWSNRGDESNMTLTKEFDFTNIEGPLTLAYWTWYDLEEDYDYLYLVASIDGGETWKILTTPSGTAEDPSGNSFGWGYNGLSGVDGQWIQEKIEISQFAGEEVLLRFEYVTDTAVNGNGFLIDDIQIPEINYFTDFENDSGGWESAGFVRMDNILPQTFQISLISINNEVNVQTFSLEEGQAFDIPLIFEEGKEIILVVSGTTRYTRQPAEYSFEILSNP